MSSWYGRQTDIVKLMVVLLLNTAVFLIIELTFNAMGIFDTRRPIMVLLFISLIMGLSVTVFSKWKLVKTVFSNNKNGKNT